MGVVDDLPMWNELRRELGESTEQHGGEREVADSEDATLRSTRRGVDLGEIRLRQPRRADDDVGGLTQGREHVGLRCVGFGVVDEDVATMRERISGGRQHGRGETAVAQDVAERPAGMRARDGGDDLEIG